MSFISIWRLLKFFFLIFFIKFNYKVGSNFFLFIICHIYFVINYSFECNTSFFYISLLCVCIYILFCLIFFSLLKVLISDFFLVIFFEIFEATKKFLFFIVSHCTFKQWLLHWIIIKIEVKHDKFMQWCNFIINLRFYIKNYFILSQKHVGSCA